MRRRPGSAERPARALKAPNARLGATAPGRGGNIVKSFESTRPVEGITPQRYKPYKAEHPFLPIMLLLYDFEAI